MTAIEPGGERESLVQWAAAWIAESNGGEHAMAADDVEYMMVLVERQALREAAAKIRGHRPLNLLDPLSIGWQDAADLIDPDRESA